MRGCQRQLLYYVSHGSVFRNPESHDGQHAVSKRASSFLKARTHNIHFSNGATVQVGKSSLLHVIFKIFPLFCENYIRPKQARGCSLKCNLRPIDRKMKGNKESCQLQQLFLETRSASGQDYTIMCVHTCTPQGERTDSPNILH